MERKLALFKALSDETRLRIIEFLVGGEKCVCRIYPHVKRSQSNVSIQLRRLESVGILRQRREGRYVFYSIADDGVRKVLNALSGKKR